VLGAVTKALQPPITNNVPTIIPKPPTIEITFPQQAQTSTKIKNNQSNAGNNSFLEASKNNR
jgi:hypothetical protein